MDRAIAQRLHFFCFFEKQIFTEKCTKMGVMSRIRYEIDLFRKVRL